MKHNKQSITLREARENDKEIFVELTSALSRFNRQHHDEKSTYDDYSQVLEAIKSQALKTFENRDDGRTYIILAEYHQDIVGYGLARVYDEDATADNGTVDIGKNYKYLFQYLPAEKEKEFSNLLDFSSVEKLTQSLFATMELFHQEAQFLAHKMGFDYDMEVAEKMIEYAEERLINR